MIRLIAIDVDGTLLDSDGDLPPANAAAIHDAVAQGVQIALVTGRSYPFARPVANGLPPGLSLIVSNGAVERTMDGGTVARRLLDQRVARDVLAATRAHRHAAVLIFDRDADRQVVFETMDWEHPGRQKYWSRNHAHIAKAVPLEDALVEDPIQVMFNGGVEAMKALTAEVRGGSGYAVSVTEYIHRDFSLVDITSPDATKGRALTWKAQQLGIGRDAIMAIGDNFNDLEMLEAAGTPVVMANAVDELRQRGWRVTGHQNDAGVAAAIYRWAGVQPGRFERN